MFSIVYGVLLRPLPYPDAGAIVRIGDSVGPGSVSDMRLSNRSMLLLQENAESFEQLAAYQEVSAEWNGVTLRGASVSPSLFPLFRAPPHLGRLFLEEEARTGAERVVLLSHGAWTKPLRIESGHRRNHHRLRRRPAPRRRRAGRGVPLPDPGQRILDAVRHRTDDRGECARTTWRRCLHHHCRVQSTRAASAGRLRGAGCDRGRQHSAREQRHVPGIGRGERSARRSRGSVAGGDGRRVQAGAVDTDPW